MKIEAIIIDGWHKGHVLDLEYHPVVRLLKPKEVIVDYCCDESEYPHDEEIIEYKECFRAADKKIVLYSTTGNSRDFFHGNLFDRIFTDKPYTQKTVLKYGYYGENASRTD